MKRIVRFTFSDLLNEFGRRLAGAVIDPEGGPPAEAVAAEEEEIPAPRESSLIGRRSAGSICRIPSQPRRASGFNENVLIQFGEGPSAKFGEASEVFGNADLLGRKFVSVYLRPKGDQSPDPGQLARLLPAHRADPVFVPPRIHWRVPEKA
jgi:hypothetical protein